MEIQETPQKGSPSAKNQEEVKKILRNIVDKIDLLVNLYSSLGNIKKGASIVITTREGKEVKITKKVLRYFKNQISHEILNLKNYLKTQRIKRPIDPSSFSGIYSPVVTGEALKEFFQNVEGFGLLDPTSSTLSNNKYLMDELPFARKGYVLRNTITMLFYIYMHNNNLQDPLNSQYGKFDQHLERCFGESSSFAAVFNVSKDANENTTKELMKVASLKPNFTPKNTFEVIKSVHSDFDTKKFKMYFFQNISALNYYPKSYIESISSSNCEDFIKAYSEEERKAFQQVLDFLSKKEVLDKLLEEHNIVKQTSKLWKEKNKKVKKEKKE